MRFKLRHGLKAGILFLAFSITALIFQNCGTYEPVKATGDSELAAEVVCADGAVCDESLEPLRLVIGNEGDSIALFSGDTGLDVGGFCDSAGFDTNIYYELQGPTGFATQLNSVGCDQMGRFQVHVDLPGGYSRCTQHTLVIQLKAVDPNTRTEYDNPVGLNKKQMRIIGAGC